jgi:amino acid transporter
MADQPALRRGIRFRDLVLFYVVVVLSVRWTASAATAGPGILIVWFAALTCFFIPLAASVMELSSRHPEEGGIYIWTREAFGDFSGFLCAWLYWMSNLPFFAAVLYFGAASTLYAFGPRGQSLSGKPLYYIAFSVFWLAVITILNVRGINIGKWLNNVGAFGSLIPLTVLIFLGVASYWRFGPAIHIGAGSLVPHWSLDNAVFWSNVFFAFSALEAASAMGDEIQNPRRNIPLALLLAGGILAVGYIGGTAAFLLALPAHSVDGPDGFVNGIRLMAERLGMGWMLAPIVLLVALNAVGGAAANLSSTARLPFVVGVDRYLPRAFGWIHPRWRTPWVAIAAYGVAGIVVALLGQAGTTVRGAYNVLVSMSVISLFLPYLFLFSAMIRHQGRAAGPDVRRVPGGKPVAVALAILGLISTGVTIVLSTIPGADEVDKPLAVAKVVGAMLALIGLGVAVFLVAKFRTRGEKKSAPPLEGV